MKLDETHDPGLTSWVECANQPGHAFPIQHLPFCMFTTAGDPQPRAGAGIGDFILELRPITGVSNLGHLMAFSKADRIELRRRISRFLADPANRCELTTQRDALLTLPVTIGDYTDFYASVHHATHVGRLFRPESPLLPNYKYVPVAYHGRSSSIVVSGTPVRRPSGQIASRPEGPPQFSPSARLDYEVELGVFVGPGNRQGDPIPIERAEEHLFGVTLLNDWSARDIQRWEYQPLGPFLAKNFATSISPWVTPMEALEPFRRVPKPRPAEDPLPLPYLTCAKDAAYGITLEAWIHRSGAPTAERVSRASFEDMYWTFEQMLTHHASNGCPMRPGDLMGSGTVSGPGPDERGCLLELGLPFLADGDTVILRGYAESPGARRIDLAPCAGKVS